MAEPRRPGAVDSPAAFAELLAAVSAPVRMIVEAADRLVRGVDPDAVQVVWVHQRTLGYGIGPRKASEHYCYVDVYDRHVNLGFNEGALLDDAGGVLSGTGARFRSLPVTDAGQLADPRLADLLRQARARRVEQRGG
jgi:Domain of unknown function (DU1801)